METPALFDQPLQSVSGAPVFAGSDFDPARDTQRLATQIGCILAVVLDGQYRTVTKLGIELRRAYPHVNFPENSIQAQLRNLKKVGYQVEKRNVAKSGALFEYRVLSPLNPGVGLKVREALGVRVA